MYLSEKKVIALFFKSVYCDINIFRKIRNNIKIPRLNEKKLAAMPVVTVYVDISSHKDGQCSDVFHHRSID